MTVYLPRGEYMQSKHQLSHVTVGSIAIATIMVRLHRSTAPALINLCS